jgi:sirohydrochlorin cobaltochelatase
MKGFIITMLATTFLIGQSFAYADSNNKPVIVLCAFGTSTKAMSTYDHLDKAIQKQYPEHEVRWAYTSNFIIKKLKKEGIIRHTLPEVYESLRKEGKTNVVVQSMHVVPGQEFHRKMIMVPAKGLNVKYGYPLLSEDADFDKLFKALEPSFAPEKDSVTILCGHGNDHHPEYNATLIQMDKYLREHHKNTFLATVEGQPGIDQAFADAKAAGVEKVHFVPMMLVAGDHIMNDVMGDEEDSWKNQLAPMTATAEKGMGYNDDVIKIYIEHINKALEQFGNK